MNFPPPSPSNSGKVCESGYLHFWYLNLVRLTLAPKVMPRPGPRTVERRVEGGRVQRGVRTARNPSVHHRPLDVRHGDRDGAAVGVQHARGLTQFSVVEGLQLKAHQEEEM